MRNSELSETVQPARQPTTEERAAAAAVLRMIWGLHISRAVYAIAELGIADLLADGPMTAVQLAAATDTHEQSLYRVLRLLSSLGVLTEDGNHSFGLTVLGDRLRTDVPASMRSWAMLTDSIGGVRSFGPIVETLRTGRTGLDIAYGAAAAVREFDWSVVARDVVAPASSSSPRIPRMSATSRPPCPSGRPHSPRASPLATTSRRPGQWPTSAAGRAPCWLPSCRHTDT